MCLDFCIDKCRCHSYLTGRKMRPGVMMRPGVIFPGLCQCVEFPCVLLTPLVRRHEAYPVRENLSLVPSGSLAGRVEEETKKNRLMRVQRKNSC